MPEIVKTEAWWQPRPLQVSLVRAVEVTPSERRPDAGGEDEFVFLPRTSQLHPLLELALAMSLEGADGPRGNADVPALAALGELEDAPLRASERLLRTSNLPAFRSTSSHFSPSNSPCLGPALTARTYRGGAGHVRPPEVASGLFAWDGSRAMPRRHEHPRFATRFLS